MAGDFVCKSEPSAPSRVSEPVREPAGAAPFARSSDGGYSFTSEYRISTWLPDFTDDEVKNEPMLFNCSPEFAHEHGGPITRAFLAALNEPPEVVDTRVHMLMPGWFPCIPGWHHDDVPRSRADGQPNYDTPEYRSRHALALVNGHISPTEFAVGFVDLPRIPEGMTTYQHWHDMVEAACRAGKLSRQRVPSNRVVYFNDEAFHQGVRASANGWRWFGRASWNTDRKPSNEIRRQVQVYLENVTEGW